MPEINGTSVVFGLTVALLSRWIVNRQRSPKRLPVWGVLIIAVVAGCVALPVLDHAGRLIDSAPIFAEITSGALFIGGWVALVTLTLFERKGAPRRVPVWAGLAIGLIAMVAVPPLLDSATGKYQDASLRADVNQCTSGMLGEVSPREVTNLCDYPIVVGLCLSSERNPVPCEQSVEIAPSATATFDPNDERLSSLPANPGGLTVVACRLPHRPSRTLKVGGRGYRGVCLPGA